MNYILLFVTSFIAATIFPFYSEVYLFALARSGEPGYLLILVATAGNTLGALVNWILGRYLLHYQDRKWFYFSPEQTVKMQHWFQKYGVWSLLMSWLPLVGDTLTFIAGIMKVPVSLFLVLVTIGKAARYIGVFYFASFF